VKLRIRKNEHVKMSVGILGPQKIKQGLRVLVAFYEVDW
jgi:hypothetical protein